MDEMDDKETGAPMSDVEIRLACVSLAQQVMNQGRSYDLMATARGIYSFVTGQTGACGASPGAAANQAQNAEPSEQAKRAQQDKVQDAYRVAQKRCADNWPWF